VRHANFGRDAEALAKKMHEALGHKKSERGWRGLGRRDLLISAAIVLVAALAWFGLNVFSWYQKAHGPLPTLQTRVDVPETPTTGPAPEKRAVAPAQSIVGTWRGGNFEFTFFDNGTYVHDGAIGTSGMQTQTSEKGTYVISGDNLITQRESGVIATSSQNYRQDLGP
jgi:hypothetical protein